jgi:protein-tyrosine phosphatase
MPDQFGFGTKPSYKAQQPESRSGSLIGTTKQLCCSAFMTSPAQTLDWQLDAAWLTEHVGVGGFFPTERSAELARDHGVRGVVDLRGETCDDEEALRRAGIAFLHLPTPDLEPVSVEMLDQGVQFAKAFIERGEKVLIHCQHGIGRSALLALCLLVDMGFEPLEALLHAKGKREKISPSPSQYQGWARWLRAKGHEVPDQHTFGCIAYRHLAQH